MREQELRDAVDKINLSEERQRIILEKANRAYQDRKDEKHMKTKKRLPLVVVAATLIFGVTAFAAGGVVTGWYSSSSAFDEYRTLPTEQQCVKDIGYAPLLIESFENGYSFHDGHVVNHCLTDENDNALEKFKSVSFTYEKDGDKVYMEQEKYNTPTEEYGDVVASVDGIDLYYSGYTNKFVPADYEMTDEDRAAEQSGELVFSYGSDEVEIVEIQSLHWTKDGVQYMLMQMDGRLSVEDLTQMAEQMLQA